MKNVWIEKISNSSIRRTYPSSFRIGKVLFSPKVGSDGRDTYANMRKVEKDDVVIHLVDNKVISSVSLVKSKKVIEQKIDFTNWSGQILLLKLHNNIKILNALLRDDFLSENDKDLLTKISELSEVFYTRNLNFRQGAYLTPCSKELLSHFNTKYKNKSNRNLLPHISKKMLYDDYENLLEYLSIHEDDIAIINKEIGSERGKYVMNHNKEVEVLKKSFKNLLSFDFVKSLVKLPRGGDIDLVLGHEKTLILIEYKSGRKKHREQVKDFIAKQPKLCKYLFTDFEHTNADYDKIVYIYIAKNISVTNLNKISNDFIIDEIIKAKSYDNFIDDKKIKIIGTNLIHRHTMQHYFDLSNSLDSYYAKRDFLKDINVEPEESEYFSVPAIKTYLNREKGELIYLFNCSAKTLAKFSSVSRRKVGSEGYSTYQRLVKSSRLTSIGTKFLDEGNKFANNIILKLNEEKVGFKSILSNLGKYEVDDLGTRIDFGILSIRTDYNSSWVIDGQHRLFSYLKTKNDNIDDSITVSALVGIDDETEARFFIDINDNAQSVDKDLIWDLIGNIDRNSDKGIISNACKKLFEINKDGENNIFYQNIRIPSLSRKGHGFGGLCRTLYDDCKLTHEKLVRNGKNITIIKNPFNDEDSEKCIRFISNGIFQFFSEINKRLDETKVHALYNDAVIAIFCMLAREYFSYHKRRNILKNDTGKFEKGFFEAFTEIITSYNEEQIYDLRKQSNSQQKSDQLKDFILQLKISYDPDFGSNEPSDLVRKVWEFIEVDLKKMIYKSILNEYSVNFVTEIFSNKVSKLRAQGLQTGRVTNDDDLYLLLNTKDVIDKVVFSGKLHIEDRLIDLWNDHFSEIFISHRSGFIDKNAINTDYERLAQYRASAEAHNKRDLFTKDKRNLVKAIYNRFYSIVSDQLKKLEKII